MNCLIFFISLQVARIRSEPKDVCIGTAPNYALLNDLLDSDERNESFNPVISLRNFSNVIVWTASQTKRLFPNQSTTYYLGLDHIDYRIFQSLIQSAKREFYIDVNPSNQPISGICGYRSVMPISPYSANLGSINESAEVCEVFTSHHILQLNALLKLRFSQNANSKYRSLEIYPHYIVESAMWPPTVAQLSKLVFTQNPHVEMNNELLPKVVVVIRECSPKVRQENASLPIKAFYHGKKLYYSWKRLCQTVNEPGFYDVIYHDRQTAENHYINELQLGKRRLLRDQSTVIVYMIVESDFESVIIRNRHFFITSGCNMSVIYDSFGFTIPDVMVLNEYRINMINYNAQGHCTLMFLDRKTGAVDTQLIFAHERFELTQSLAGVQMNVTSTNYPTSSPSFPQHLLIHAECPTNELGTPILEISQGAALTFHQRIATCHRRNYITI